MRPTRVMCVFPEKSAFLLAAQARTLALKIIE